MFKNSAANVETRLRGMIKEVEGSMSDKTDEVFTLMRRDYRSVIGGDVPQQGQILPRDQRLVRKDVMKLIKGVEKAFMKVTGVDVKDEEDQDEDEENDPAPSEKAEPIRVKGEPSPSDQATHDQGSGGSASSAGEEAASADGATAAAAMSEEGSEASAQGLDNKVDLDTDVSNGSSLSDID